MRKKILLKQSSLTLKTKLKLPASEANKRATCSRMVIFCFKNLNFGAFA